jgi:hypothetical protein
MLEKLLAEIRQGGTLRPAALAVRLGVSVALVEAMLGDLERRGMITLLDSTCGSKPCGGCPLSDACGQPTAPQRIWMLAARPR